PGGKKTSWSCCTTLRSVISPPPVVDLSNAGRVPPIGEKGPEALAARGADHPADPLLPKGFRAPLVAPRPQAAGCEMQRMLLGKTHGAVNLMADRRDLSGGFAAPRLGDRNGKTVVAQALRFTQGVGRRG